MTGMGEWERGKWKFADNLKIITAYEQKGAFCFHLHRSGPGRN